MRPIRHASNTQDNWSWRLWPEREEAKKRVCVKKNALVILEFSKDDGRSMKLFHSDSEFLSKFAQQSRFGSTEHANRVQLAQLDAESIKKIHGRAIFIWLPLFWGEKNHSRKSIIWELGNSKEFQVKT